MGFRRRVKRKSVDVKCHDCAAMMQGDDGAIALQCDAAAALLLGSEIGLSAELTSFSSSHFFFTTSTSMAATTSLSFASFRH